VNGHAVLGCKYRKGGVFNSEYGPVVFGSGGHGADFGNDSLLAKYTPADHERRALHRGPHQDW